MLGGFGSLICSACADKHTTKTMEIANLQNIIKQLENERIEILKSSLPRDYGHTARTRLKRLSIIELDIQALRRVIKIAARYGDVK